MNAKCTVAMVLIAMASCTAKPKEESASEFCTHFKARDCRLSYGIGHDSKKGAIKAIVLTLEGIDDLEAQKNKEYVTSLAAGMLYERQDPKALKEFTEIQVKAKGPSSSFQMRYAMRDMDDLLPSIEPIQAFFQALSHRRFQAVPALIDTTSIPAEAVVSGSMELDSLHGPLTGLTVLGFKFFEWKDHPALCVWTSTTSQDSTVTYIQFHVDRTNHLIFSLAVNDF